MSSSFPVSPRIVDRLISCAPVQFLLRSLAIQPPRHNLVTLGHLDGMELDRLKVKGTRTNKLKKVYETD